MPLILGVDADTKKATSKIKGASKQAAADVKKLEKKSVASASKIKSAFTALGPVLGALGFAVVLRGLKNLVTETITFRDEIAKFSKATGIGVEFLSAMGFAAERSGASIESMNKGFGRLARNISDAENGLATPLRAFEALGINITKADGSLRNLQEIFPDIAEGFKNMTDSTKKAALAQELFGRAGLELVPLLNLGAEGVAELTREAERLGIVFGEQAAVEAEAAADALLNFNTAAKALGQNLVSSTLPALTSMANFLANITATIQEFGEFRQEFLTGFGGLIEPEDLSRLDKAVSLLREFQEIQTGATAAKKFQADALSFQERQLAATVNAAEVEQLRNAVLAENLLLLKSQVTPLEIQATSMEEVIAGLGEAVTLSEQWAENQAALADTVPDLPEDITIVNEQMEAASQAAGRFTQNLARALTTGRNLEDTIKSLAVNFALSFLPGGSLFGKFAHGGIAPGGFVPSIVGEGGGAPEIVQSASPIRVTPLTTNNNTNFGGFSFIFPNVKSIDRFTLENEIMPQIKEIISEGGVI